MFANVLPRFVASITAIFIASNDRTFADLCQIFAAAGWRITRADSWQNALQLPDAGDATHFLYEHIPNDQRWIDALSAIRSLPLEPAFIMTSRFGDERLWAEVLNRGGYDLLLEPFSSTEVTRVIAAAFKNTNRVVHHSAPVP